MKCVFCGTELVLGFGIHQDTVEEKQLETEFFCIILFPFVSHAQYKCVFMTYTHTHTHLTVSRTPIPT